MIYVMCKKTIFVIALLLSFTAGVSAAVLESVEGDVRYKSYGEEDWTAALPNQQLNEGDSIATFENSQARIIFPAGHSIRVGARSTFEMKDTSEDIMLEILRGQVLSRVSELSPGRRFEVATPQAVTAVRGTLFSVEITPDAAETVVQVFEGEVLSREIITGAEVIVPAGRFTRVRPETPPTEPEDISHYDSGEPDMHAEAPADEESDSETVTADEESEPEPAPAALAELPEAEEEPAEEPAVAPAVSTRDTVRTDLRNEIRSAVSDIKVELRSTQDTIQQKKDSDSVTGRTMRDYHGNLVRVEQHLLRPDSKTIQFINITKRDNYNYRGVMGVPSSGARLDTIETRVSFTEPLPERYSRWPNFFSDAEDSDTFRTDRWEIRISNQHDAIRILNLWDPVEDGFADPEMRFISGREGETYGEWIVDMDTPDEFDAGEGIGFDNESSMAWMISPKLRVYRPGDTLDSMENLRLGFEGWFINNDGRLVDVDSLSGGNPFDTIKRIAIELAGVVRYGFEESYILDSGVEVDSDKRQHREAALEGFAVAKDFFEKNFDIVITPDFLYNVLEEMASNLDLDAFEGDNE